MYRTLQLALLICIAALAGASNSHAQALEWQVAPYLWAANVGLDMDINGDPVLGVDVPFNDLVDKLDGAFMLHAEVRGPKFGAFADIISLKLADSGITSVGPGGPLLGDLITETELQLGLFEIGGLYRFGEAVPGSVAIDVLLGIRLVDVDQSVNITLPDPAETMINRTPNVSEVDFVMGARAIGKFTDRWGYRVRADYGTGGTDGTFNFIGTVGYTFGETGLFTLDFGYRHLQMELSKGLENGAVSSSDITFSGPLVGLVFNF